MAIRALMIDRQDEGIERRIIEFPEDVLPEGNVRISIEYSSINYKDALILAGKGNLVRTYPHVPGIDLAGTVIESSDPTFTEGDRVVLTGWRVGEIWWGGFAEQACVKGEWLVHCPDALTLRESMIFGTAGLTAALACLALRECGVDPDSGAVLVTGATGGLGSIAVHLLARMGYDVAAATGKPEQAQLLKDLGASEVVDRREIGDPPAKPLLVERWAGVVDAVGGSTLSHAAAEVRYGGCVALCGNAGGNQFPGNVLPFLLRGITFSGMDSVMASRSRRLQAWDLIGQHADMSTLAPIVHEVGLDGVADCADAMLKGSSAGRTLVRVQGGT